MDDKRDEYTADSDDQQKYDPYAEFEKRQRREQILEENAYEDDAAETQNDDGKYDAYDDDGAFDTYDLYDDDRGYDAYDVYDDEWISDDEDAYDPYDYQIFPPFSSDEEEAEEEEKYDSYKRFEERFEERDSDEETEEYDVSDDPVEERFGEEEDTEAAYDPYRDPAFHNEFEAGYRGEEEDPDEIEGQPVPLKGKKGKSKKDKKTGFFRKKRGKKKSGKKGNPNQPMNNGGKKKRKKKRTTRKFRRRVRLVILLLLLIAGLYVFLSSSIFAISDITVQNNVMQSDKVIIQQAGIKKGANIFSYHEKDVKKAIQKGNSYISDVKISRELPNRFIITVEENTPVAAIRYGEKYLILDKNGCVVGVEKTQITASRLIGIKVKSYKKGQKPVVKNKYAMQQGMKLIKKVNESGLFFKKLDVSSTLMVTGYITDDLKCTGKIEDIIDNLEGIKAVVYNLGQKDSLNGTINVGSDGFATYTEDTNVIAESDTTGSSGSSATSSTGSSSGSSTKSSTGTSSGNSTTSSTGTSSGSSTKSSTGSSSGSSTSSSTGSSSGSSTKSSTGSSSGSSTSSSTGSSSGSSTSSSTGSSSGSSTKSSTGSSTSSSTSNGTA